MINVGAYAKGRMRSGVCDRAYAIRPYTPQIANRKSQTANRKSQIVNRKS
jgi:hypothetical protein